MNFLSEFPNFSKLIDKDISRELSNWIRNKREYFEILENDLEILLRFVSFGYLKHRYRKDFSKRLSILETIHEIHIGAKLARAGRLLSIHEKNPDNPTKTFDFKIQLESFEINIEAKTRNDFPFNRNEIFYAYRREGFDQRYFGRSNNGEPESTKIREILTNAAHQLPDSGHNLIALGQIFAPRNLVALKDFQNALLGDSVLFDYGIKDKKWERIDNGLFYQQCFRDKISGVIWFQLKGDSSAIDKKYHLLSNPSKNGREFLEMKKKFESIFPKETNFPNIDNKN